MMTTPSPDSLTDNRRSCKFRWLGFLPLTFFAARVVEYVWVAGTPEQILWCCHLSNLLLAGGLFLKRPRFVRIAALWLLVGLPPWILDMILTRLVTPVSIFSHLGGTVVALLALQRVRVTGHDWFPGLICFVIMQQVTRLLIPSGPLTNVNVAHFAYGPWQSIFSSYWFYILINTILAAAGLWLLERLLAVIFPSPAEKSAS